MTAEPGALSQPTPSTVDEPDVLGRQVRTGLRWSFINSVVGRAGQVVVGIVLARLLTPYDYGVFAVALVAYTILISCSELGVTVALISRRGDSSKIGSTVTTLSWVSGAVLTLAIWLAAPAVTRQLDTADATDALRVLSLAILVAGFAAVPGAIVQRDFQQNWRFAADSANFLVSTGVAVVGALLGGGALALAWSRVAGNGVSAVILGLGAKERFRPGFRPAVAVDLLRFGLPLAGASVLAFAVMNVDYVVVASTIGPIALGYYMIAFNLSGFPVTTFSTMVRSVSLPAFGRLREVPGSAGEGFVMAARLLVTVTVPVTVLLAVLAEPLIHIVYGAKWLPAVVSLMLLSGLGLFRVFHELVYDYLAAMGRSRVVLLVQLIWLVALAILLPLGAQRLGLPGVGLGHLVAAFTLILPIYVVVLGTERVSRRRLLSALVRPVLGGLAVAGASLACLSLTENDVVRLLLGGTVGMLAYLMVVGPTLPARWQPLSPWSWPGLVRSALTA